MLNFPYIQPIQPYLNNVIFPQNISAEDLIIKMNILNNKEKRTTVELKNINRKLTSELILKELDKIYNEKRTYNAIYTSRKEGHKKNSGHCCINFINPGYIINLLDNINIFDGKNKCEFSWCNIQGDEFNKIMNERKKENICLDYIIFNDF